MGYLGRQDVVAVPTETPAIQGVHVTAAATPPSDPGPENPGPLLTTHAAIVLLMASFMGVIAGILTLYNTDAAAALLAGVTGFGISVPVLHKLIGG